MSIHPRILFTVGCIVTLLIIASVVTKILKQRYPERDFSELANRVRTWWYMVAVFTLALLLSRTVSLIFFAFLSFLAFKEYISLVPVRRADRRILFWAYAAIPLQYTWAGIAWYGMFIIFIPVYVLLFLPFRMVMIGETKGFLTAVGSIHWGMMMTIFSISHIAYLLVMPGEGTSYGGGPAMVLYLVVLTQLNDVAQYIWGKRFGKTKVVPSVSPGKTVAGFLGGLGTTIVLALLLAPILTPLSVGLSVAAGAIIGAGGFIGDCCISALKRDLGVKDSGGMLPGHGGILDRVDSLTYTAPLFFHFAHYFLY